MVEIWETQCRHTNTSALDFQKTRSKLLTPNPRISEQNPVPSSHSTQHFTPITNNRMYTHWFYWRTTELPVWQVATLVQI